MAWLVLGLAAAAFPAAAQEAGDAAETERLHAMFDREWEHAMQTEPTWASRLGDRRYNDRWPDVSLAAVQAEQQHARELLAEVRTFDPAKLSRADQLNLRIFRRQVEMDVALHPYRWFLIPLNQRGGIQTAADLAQSLRFETVKDYEDWLARMNAFPTYMQRTMELMQQGLRERIVHPKIIMQRLPRQVRAHLVEDATQSLFYQPFRQMHESISAEDQQRLQAAAAEAVMQKIVPAYRQFAEFLEQQYIPSCYDEVGVWQLPLGERMYAAMAQNHTTTNLTPDQIHTIGLREVGRIRAEMMKVIQQAQFTGSFEEFLTFLRTDPQFYVNDPQELLLRYRAKSKEIDLQVPRLFRTMPRMPYGVTPIPDHIAPDTTTAYYQQPAADGSRAGQYFVNLYKPETRPLYEMEALSIHEAVPGHHFQIALAMELPNMPNFRKHGHFTAFIEGWALYSESLGEEMGFYADPYSKFGQLTYEMWRACRLVVDTGMHSKRWTRQQAIDFMKANTAKTELDIINEIDRYIAWPGQALAYKIGELRIKQLRSRAEKQLGEKFDIRAFHDVVLLDGAVPLDVLGEHVEAWVKRVQAEAKAESAEPKTEAKPAE